MSLAERANLKRNSPAKSRKRPRATFEDDEDLESIDDFDEQPPRKRRNTVSERSQSSSDSSMPLKPRASNNNKRQLKRVNVMEDSDESEEYVPKPKKKRLFKKKQL